MPFLLSSREIIRNDGSSGSGFTRICSRSTPEPLIRQIFGPAMVRRVTEQGQVSVFATSDQAEAQDPTAFDSFRLSQHRPCGGC